MSFGSTIKRFRKEKGYTQDQLANLLSVTPQAISRWENNSAMPDISLLIPIANVFSVSTDTLLEVDIARNHEHIADFADNALTFSPPYGSKMAEKLAIYRDEVRKYPDSIELREALYQILTHYVSLTGSFKDPTIAREMASLAEDIIEMGGSADHYKTMLAFFCQDLNNPERAKSIVDNASGIMASKEVLLPTSLTGRKRVESQKKLIYKCADIIRRTVFDMYDQQEITPAELQALSPAEKIMDYLYGVGFSHHFENVTTLYVGVKASLTRGDIADALFRLDGLVSRLELQERESASIPELVPEYEVELHYLSGLGLFNIKNQATILLGYMRNDFGDEAAKYRDRLERLCKSDGGQLKRDCSDYIISLTQKLKEGSYVDPVLEDVNNEHT